MRNTLNKKGLFLISLLTLLFIAGFNCSTDIADGGTEAGNAKIIGKVVDENGNPLDNAIVSLNEKCDTIFKHYNTDTTIGYDTAVSTDSKGMYAFNLPDTGMYHIIVEKYKRFLVFIDSIHVFDTVTIVVPTDTVMAPGTITGKVLLEDTTNVSNKLIRVMCSENKDYVVEVSHGETFTFSDIPRGFFSIYSFPESDLFLPQCAKIEVISGNTSDLGEIKLIKISNYLLSSNVMTSEFNGLDSLPVDIIPQYTFVTTPQLVQMAKVGVYPKGVETITVEAVINGNSIMLNHQEDFPRGKEIGVYLTITFANREDIALDFMTIPKKRFSTIP